MEPPEIASLMTAPRKSTKEIILVVWRDDGTDGYPGQEVYHIDVYSTGDICLILS